MSKQTRYLLTVDSVTGTAVKLERLGEEGDLTEVPLSTLAVAPLGVPGALPVAGAGAPLAPQSLVINIYMGGPQQAASLSISAPGLVGPGVAGAPGAPTMLVGPGAPGGQGASAASTQGPVGPSGLSGSGEGGSR